MTKSGGQFALASPLQILEELVPYPLYYAHTKTDCVYKQSTFYTETLN